MATNPQRGLVRLLVFEKVHTMSDEISHRIQTTHTFHEWVPALVCAARYLVTMY